MAVGFPAKVSYVDGDVFSSSDINDTNGTLNLVNPATTGTVQANPVINSAFQIWQRGTSFATGSLNYFADRWQSARQGQVAGLTISRQATSDTTNLPFIQYCARVQRNLANASTNALLINTALESVNSIPFAGKTVTLSFYVRAGANYSPTSGALDYKLQTGTGTDQNNLSGSFTGSTNAIAGTATLTTTWQRVQASATLAASATQIGIQFQANVTGVAGAADFFEVTGVQLDIGSVALPFRTYAGTIQGELAACQRYYVRNTGPSTTTIFTTAGISQTATASSVTFQLPVTKRVSPTSVDYSGLNLTDLTNYNLAVTALTISATECSPYFGALAVTVASGATSNRPAWLRATGTGSFLGLSAEL
jgi:hypothetical protein